MNIMKKKSRKIILGSLLVICLLMMAPTISAIQSKNIINNDIEKLDIPDRFPLLYIYFCIVLSFKMTRIEFWYYLSGWDGNHGQPEWLFAFDRANMLLQRFILWIEFRYLFGKIVDWW